MSYKKEKHLMVRLDGNSGKKKETIMKRYMNYVIVMIIALAFIAPTAYAGQLKGKENCGKHNGYAWAWGRLKENDKARKEVMGIMKKYNMTLNDMGYTELGAYYKDTDNLKAEKAAYMKEKAGLQLAATKATQLQRDLDNAKYVSENYRKQVVTLTAEKTELESNLTDCQVDSQFGCPAPVVSDAATTTLAATTVNEETAVEETAGSVADPRKFAISQVEGQMPGIYTNSWTVDEETASKLKSMDPGVFHIVIQVTDMENGVNVKIEHDVEGFEWNKDGYDWFIGQTIFG